MIRPCTHGYMPGKCSKHKDCPNHKKPRLKAIDPALQAQADELGRSSQRRGASSWPPSKDRRGTSSRAKPAWFFTMCCALWVGRAR